MKVIPYIILALALFELNCSKGELEDTCMSFEEQARQFPPETTFPEISISNFNGSAGLGIVDVNPNDPDEFLKWTKGPAWSAKLYRYNKRTREKLFLPPNPFNLFFSPHWSRKDWLLFSAQSGPQQWDAYKMKSNGDSLTRLTYLGNVHYPEWNWEGDKFVCSMGLTSPVISVIFDENGNALDTIPGGGAEKTWQHPSLMASSGPGFLKVQDPQTGQFVFQVSFDDSKSSFAGGCAWIDEENIVWSYEEGVFRSNIVTQETVQLVETCDAIRYHKPLYPFVTGRLIFTRSVYNMTSFWRGTVHSEAVTIDPFDGTIEVIEIDGL
jgi:hypothetical protein